MTLLHRYNKGISLLPSVDLLLNYAYGLLNLVGVQSEKCGFTTLRFLIQVL